MDRLISLSIGTEGTEEYVETFRQVADFAHTVADRSYLSVSAQVVGYPNPEVEPDLYYDENTLVKVKHALLTAVAPFGYGTSDTLVDDLIHSMQNAGILFRERSRSEGDGRDEPVTVPSDLS